MKRTKSMVYKETIESNELYLYTINTGTLYTRSILPTLENLKKKYKKGIYDKEKAIDAFYHISTEAAKMYAKEFCSADFRFSVQDRFTVAVEMEAYYFEDFVKWEA